MTIESFIHQATLTLQQGNIQQPRFEAELLLAFVLDCDRVTLYTHSKDKVDSQRAERYTSLVERRAHGEPYAYLTGSKEFMGLAFSVDPGVLIPRPDTECVVEAALSALPAEAKTVLDVCTGSGAIGVAIGHYRPDVKVTMTDISEAALAVAEKNARKNGVDARLIQSDLFDALPEGARFDLIISNPPYIPKAEIQTLDRDVKDFEPMLALDGGIDGYDIYRRLIPSAFERLLPGGLLVLECGHDQGKTLARAAKAAGFQDVKLIFDLAGRQRGIVGVRSEE